MAKTHYWSLCIIAIFSQDVLCLFKQIASAGSPNSLSPKLTSSVSPIIPATPASLVSLLANPSLASLVQTTYKDVTILGDQIKQHAGLTGLARRNLDHSDETAQKAAHDVSSEQETTEEETTDFLEDEISRSVVEKAVQTTLNIYKNPSLRQAVTSVLKSVNGLFENEMAYEIVDSLTSNLNRLLLIPDNLQMLSKVIDLGTMVLLDQDYHKVIDRELKLVDRFLEDPLLRLTFVKVGKVMVVLTTNEDVYAKSSEIATQINNLLSKENLKTLSNFCSSMSKTLTGGVPQINNKRV